MRPLGVVIGAAFYVALPVLASAQSAIDPTAQVVELRSSCAMPGGGALDNCFETTADLTAWLWGGGRASAPNSLDPVSVRVGPGDFDRLQCQGAMNGWVSFQGTGREHTRFINDDPTPDPAIDSSICPGGITVDQCTNLHFTDLAAKGRSIGIHWLGDGSSNWNDVDAVADAEGSLPCTGFPYAFAWYDASGTGNALHYFWDTRFIARGASLIAVAYYSLASETWIYASDLLTEITGPGTLVAGVNAAAAADIRIFGSTVRTVASPTTTGVVHGLLVGSTLHMHGGIVNVSAQGDGAAGAVSLISIRANAGSFVHTPETAFVFNGHPNATRTRINGPPESIESPFLWPSGPVPPDITSLTGADLFVKTNEGPGQNEARLLVYDVNCSPSPWRRVSDDACL